MALSRKFLQALGIEDEKIEQIIENHADTVNALKEERDRYKADAEKLPELQKRVSEMEEAEGKDPWKVKYEAVKEDFESYKGEQEKRQRHAEKEKAYRELLKQAGVSERRIDSVLRVSDVESVELEDGKVKDSEKLVESIKDEWSDFIVETVRKGAEVAKPGEQMKNPVKPTRDEIMAIKDRRERRRVMAENMDVFDTKAV